MKKKFIYTIMVLLGFIALSSCNEDSLNTIPTDSMSGEGLFANANTALVPLNGIYRSMYVSGWQVEGNEHQSFGPSAHALMADVMGEDHIMAAAGSGWFWYDAIYDVKRLYDRKNWRSYDLWNTYYTWIANANYIIAAEETMDGDTNDVNYVIGQGYAIRAYSYFMLAQNFARTYKGHESDPCCPIYTEPTTAGTQGNPRSSVKDVYEQITKDINKATELLEGTKKKHITHIDYIVANGIKARIALTMEDWKTALAAAEIVIDESGASIEKVEDFAGLNDVGKKNVIWGAKIISDQSGMYAGFFTHMDNTDYYGKSALKQINKQLYAKLGDNDDRRAWWNPQDPNNEDGGYQQEKFKFADIKDWLGDYIWMRVEEMYLTAAEAAVMLDDETTAKKYLEALMDKRDPDYSITQTGKELGTVTSTETGSLREEIINQRRLELWGEYGRIYDIRRLRQGFRRTVEMGWPEPALLGNKPTDNPESYMWVLTIPQSEFDGNENMDPVTDQNPIGDLG